MGHHARAAHSTLLKLLIRIALFLGLIGGGVLALPHLASGQPQPLARSPPATRP